MLGWGSVSLIDATREKEFKAITEFLDATLKGPFLYAHKVFAIEGNSSGIRANELSNALRRRYGSCTCMQENHSQPNVPHVWTGPDEPDRYQAHTNYLLHTEGVVLYKDLTFYRVDTISYDVKLNVEDMNRQLSNYCLMMDEGRDPALQAPRGKWSGKGQGSKDDLAVSFMAVLWWSQVFFSEAKYQHRFSFNPVH